MKMRRFKQELSVQEQERIWLENEYGVLAVNAEDEQPYALPINYIYDQGKIYFHGALSGYKNQYIGHGEKASFCVVDSCVTDVEKFTSQYESVIAFGTVNLVESEEEKRHIFELFCRKFFLGKEDKWEAEIRKGMRLAELWCLNINSKSGKGSMNMVK